MELRIGRRGLERNTGHWALLPDIDFEGLLIKENNEFMLLGEGDAEKIIYQDTSLVIYHETGRGLYTRNYRIMEI